MTTHTDNEIFHKLAMFKKELTEIMRESGLEAAGHPAKEAAQVQRKMIAALVDKLQQQDRHIAWMIGDSYEPQHHFAEAVIVGVTDGAVG